MQCWYCSLVSITDTENLLAIFSVYHLTTMTLGKSILILLYIIESIFCLIKSFIENMSELVIRMFTFFCAGSIYIFKKT